MASLLDDEVASLRALGALEMMTGKTGEAHAHFQQALDLFGTKYPGYDAFTKNSTNFITEMNWAVSEASASDKEAAAKHLNKAEQLVRAMPRGDQTEVYKAQLNYTKNATLAPVQDASTHPLAVSNFGQVPALATPPPIPKKP